jgi:hypothetical protein
VPGNRHRPDGVELRWRQIGVKGLQSDAQLPFFIQWETDIDQHPSHNASGRLSLEKLEIAGDPSRVAEWVGTPSIESIGGIDVSWMAPNGTPGIVAASFATADGVVRI